MPQRETLLDRRYEQIPCNDWINEQKQALVRVIEIANVLYQHRRLPSTNSRDCHTQSGGAILYLPEAINERNNVYYGGGDYESCCSLLRKGTCGPGNRSHLQW